MFKRCIFIFLILASSSEASSCDFTDEYIEELASYTESTLDKYSSCLSSAANFNYWKSLAECKNQSSAENCEELIKKYVDRPNNELENSEHCKVFARELQEFDMHAIEKGIEKCKT